MSSSIQVRYDPRPLVTINRTALADERLTWAARGLLAYLLGVPEVWVLTIDDVRKRGDLGRDAFRNLLNQLEAHGYIERRLLRDGQGRLGGTAYTVIEVPETRAANTEPERPGSGPSSVSVTFTRPDA